MTRVVYDDALLTVERGEPDGKRGGPVWTFRVFGIEPAVVLSRQQVLVLATVLMGEAQDREFFVVVKP